MKLNEPVRYESKLMRTLKELSDLNGRVAVVTGGAGHIGMAIAEALLELGCMVCLVDISQDALDKAIKSYPEYTEKLLFGMTADLEDQSVRITLVNDLIKQFGRVDILINNAGFVGDSQLQGWVADFENQNIETWRRAIEVNLTAPFHLTQLLSQYITKSGRGVVINIGSIYGIVGPDWDLYSSTKMGNPAAYASSKGGLLQMTRWLATTMAPKVRVNCISPGGLARGQPESFVTKYVNRTPLKRMGSEEDFKGVVAFLASDLSAWVTGQNFIVDGGWTVW
ncbi:MAG TPA: SDR family oxidoreductase [Methylotenera sp.]|nr:SDR family oxidoreductase [Methylotenera sp.]HPH04756.1 SDR family oxidoreductase [Methylotenera sp.]